MPSRSQKLKVGIFTLATAALVVVVLAVFAGMRFWEDRDRYVVEFDGTVYGLEPGSNVYLNGIKVGVVDSIAPSKADIGKVAATIEIDDAADVRQDTRAMLQYAGITGLRIIDLRGGTQASPPLAPGSTIPPGETTLDKLSRQAEVLADESAQLMIKANKIVDNLTVVTDPAKFARMEEIVENLAVTTTEMKHMVAESRTAMRSTLASVDAAAGSAKTALDRTTELLDTQVGQLIADASKLIADVGAVFTANEGAVRSAVFDLRQASRSFKELAREVRQRPSRLLFSDAPGERKLP
jgi:phospholipid/cholesterol/gamma-HCH transport system substrate-binding protein